MKPLSDVSREMRGEIPAISMPELWQRMRDDEWHGKDIPCMSHETLLVFTRWFDKAYLD